MENNKNLELYNKVREVPKEAQKPIIGGRLKGMTDINPIWRVKTLTEQFGVCGIGWKYEILDKRIETGANGVMCAFVDIGLFIKIDNKWSDAIVGTGGSCFVAKENAGLYTNDECFKMALTDAISVTCKMLGIGADIYWQKDTTKYDEKEEEPSKKIIQPIPTNQNEGEYCPACGSPLVLKDGKYGKFWSCAGYPKCQHKQKKYIEKKDKENKIYSKSFIGIDEYDDDNEEWGGLTDNDITMGND